MAKKKWAHGSPNTIAQLFGTGEIKKLLSSDIDLGPDEVLVLIEDGSITNTYTQTKVKKVLEGIGDKLNKMGGKNEDVEVMIADTSKKKIFIHFGEEYPLKMYSLDNNLISGNLMIMFSIARNNIPSLYSWLANSKEGVITIRDVRKLTQNEIALKGLKSCIREFSTEEIGKMSTIKKIENECLKEVGRLLELYAIEPIRFNLSFDLPDLYSIKQAARKKELSGKTKSHDKRRVLEIAIRGPSGLFEEDVRVWGDFSIGRVKTSEGPKLAVWQEEIKKVSHLVECPHTISRLQAVDDIECVSCHARFFWKDDKLYIQDMGSTNGTKINDKTVQGWEKKRKSDIVEISTLSDVELGDFHIRVEPHPIPPILKQLGLDSVDLSSPIIPNIPGKIPTESREKISNNRDEKQEMIKTTLNKISYDVNKADSIKERIINGELSEEEIAKVKDILMKLLTKLVKIVHEDPDNKRARELSEQTHDLYSQLTLLETGSDDFSIGEETIDKIIRGDILDFPILIRIDDEFILAASEEVS